MRLRVGATAAAIVIAGCGSPAAPALTYPTYTYSCCAEIVAGMLSWHAGQHVSLHWQARAGPPTTDEIPHDLSLKVTVTGPFQTVDALKQAISQGRNPSGVRSTEATSQLVSDRTPEVPTSELHLPADLPPGYYNVGWTVTAGVNSAGGAAIVTVH